MQGIQKITQEVNKKGKIGSEETTKKVIVAFLEVFKQKIIQGESINFKGYFGAKRLTTKPKGNKNCDEHQKELDKFKQANKGKGIAAYAGSAEFRNLVQETRKCKDCQKKKQDLMKSVKPINRVSFKPSEGF